MLYIKKIGGENMVKYVKNVVPHVITITFMA
jgi:hypothetical protein